MVWQGPKVAVEAIQKHFPNQKDIEIMDVCAGTGEVAKEVSYCEQNIMPPPLSPPRYLLHHGVP